MNTIDLFVNEKYWELLTKKQGKIQTFLIPNKIELEKGIENIKKTTLNFAIYLKLFDNDKKTLYGIEINANGRDRASRIPLVRLAEEHESIWKLIRNIKDFDKGINDLNKYEYFLKQSNKLKHENFPIKILTMESAKNLFLHGSEYREYIKTKIKNNNVFMIDYNLIKFKLLEGKEINITEYIKRNLLTGEITKLWSP